MFSHPIRIFPLFAVELHNFIYQHIQKSLALILSKCVLSKCKSVARCLLENIRNDGLVVLIQHCTTANMHDSSWFMPNASSTSKRCNMYPNIVLQITKQRFPALGQCRFLPKYFNGVSVFLIWSITISSVL